MKEEIFEQLFDKALEEIHLTTKEKEKILYEPRIQLSEILSCIEDKYTKELINAYEGQIGLFNAEMYHRFYYRGVSDCLKLINIGKECYRHEK